MSTLSNGHRYHSIASTLLLCLLASCNSLAPGSLPYHKLKYPGFFDIGVGYGRVSDTRGTNDDDAQGLMLSFKAYPLGRWYAEPRKDLVTGLSAADRNLISLVAQFHTKRQAAIKDAKEKQAAEEKAKAILADIEKAKDEGASAPTSKPSTNGGAPSGSGSSKPQDGDRTQQLPTIATDLKKEMQQMLERTAVVLAHSDRVLLQAAIDDSSLTDEQLKQLRILAITPPTSPEWYVVKERSNFWNRFAVFYGRSVSDFDSGGLQSEVNAIGVAFDISPDLAIQVGRGYYEVDDGGGRDSDSSLYIGMALNLNAFRRFVASAAGFE